MLWGKRKRRLERVMKEVSFDGFEWHASYIGGEGVAWAY